MFWNPAKKHKTALQRAQSNVRLAWALALGVCLLGYFEPAMAQQNAGAVAANLSGQVSNFGTLAEKLIMLGGVGVAGVSLWQWYQMSKRQQPAGAYIFGVVIGVLMVGITAVMGTGTMTFFGSNASGLSNIGVN